jgi:hypothetical protein
MRSLVVSVLTLIVTSSIAYSDQPVKVACRGEVHLSSESCGVTIVIGNQLVARCLEKSSPAFATFYSECLTDRIANLRLNNMNREAYPEIGKQCGGSIVFMEGASCGTNFVLQDKNSKYGYQSPCHDPKSDTDIFMKEIRNYCDSVLP